MRLGVAFVALALAPAATLAFPINFNRFRPGNQNCAPPSTRVVTVTVTAQPGNQTPAPPPVNNSGGNNNNNNNNNGGGKGNNNNGGKGNNGNSNNATKTANNPVNTPPPPPPVNNNGGGGSSTTSASGPAQTNNLGNGNNGNNGNSGNNNNGNNGTGNNGGGNNGNGNNGNGGDEDPQKSFTLDPRVIGSNFANDGQDEPTEGQVPSLTSANNFINFCLTLPGVPITNGQQIQTGSCNPVPIGAIPAVEKMPSSKFEFPRNFGTIKANEVFTIRMAIKNLVTGNFVNAQKSYFAAPQQLDGSGTIIGHSHVVIERINSFKDTTALDPKKFEFFKGLNGAAQGGVLTADVTKGLPVGTYRLASINAAANHQPAIVPIAQHGSLDDMIYFEVTESGDPTDPVTPPSATADPGASSTTEVSPTATQVASETASEIPSATVSEIASATETTRGGASESAKPTEVETSGAVESTPVVTASSTADNGAKTSAAATSSAAAPEPTGNGNTGAGGNLQKFVKALLGEKAPAVLKGGRGFVCEGNDFLNLSTAIQRSCDIQKNRCADKANASRSSGVQVSDCDKQAQECRAAI